MCLQQVFQENTPSQQKHLISRGRICGTYRMTALTTYLLITLWKNSYGQHGTTSNQTVFNAVVDKFLTPFLERVPLSEEVVTMTNRQHWALWLKLNVINVLSRSVCISGILVIFVWLWLTVYKTATNSYSTIKYRMPQLVIHYCSML